MAHQECLESLGTPALTQFDRLLMYAFEFNVHKVLRACSHYLGAFWFVAHLSDILQHCRQLEAYRYGAARMAHRPRRSPARR